MILASTTLSFPTPYTLPSLSTTPPNSLSIIAQVLIGWLLVPYDAVIHFAQLGSLYPTPCGTVVVPGTSSLETYEESGGVAKSWRKRAEAADWMSMSIGSWNMFGWILGFPSGDVWMLPREKGSRFQNALAMDPEPGNHLRCSLVAAICTVFCGFLTSVLLRGRCCLARR
jgi:hypothetical protein